MKAYVDNMNGVVSCIIYEDAADEYTKAVMHEVDVPEGLQAVDENGRANYKLIDGELIERAADEKALDSTAIYTGPSAQDRLNASMMLEIAKLKAGASV